MAILRPDMVYLGGGAFIMGCNSVREDEAPAHQVSVSPFYISRYAVTNQEYSVFVERTGALAPPMWHDPRFNDPFQPVVAVSWFDAAAYCAWLNEMLCETFRLPTEAEREFACRAGTTTAYPWGDAAERECGDYGRRWYAGGPEIVGGPPNAFGLCNMADNVHEWCSDWYASDYYSVSPRQDPRGPESGTRRSSRGGSWRHQVKVTRSSARSAISPAYRYTDYGFRIASSPQ